MVHLRKEMLVPQVFRLTAIVTGLKTRAHAERCIQSLLSARDPIGLEIVAVDSTSRSKIADHLESIFTDARVQKKLTILRLDARPDPGLLKNLAVPCAQGALLTFVDAHETWLPHHLETLEPDLKGHDLILGSRGAPPQMADDLRSLIDENWLVPGACVIHRALLEEAGDFPEGRLSRHSDYEFWVKALATLAKRGTRHRMMIRENKTVLTPDPKHLSPIQNRLNAFRETLSLVRLAPQLPSKYWLETAKKVIERGKKGFQ